jgi:hypothetical protein
MGINLLIQLILIVAALISTRPAAPILATESSLLPEPEEVTVCQLRADPNKYNRKLVKVTGFISHGFEDFGLFDPLCSAQFGLWVDYGGTKESNTMYCCGVVPGSSRPEVISVEGIKIPLVDDDRFKEFDGMIKKQYDVIMHATIVGRFFAGEKVSNPKGESWIGYGHLGCCALMMIQQVVSVDAHTRTDLDYRASADSPNITKEGCGFSYLGDTQFKDFIAAQQAADAGDRAWAFEDPRRVASEFLAREVKIQPELIKNLTQTRQSQGQIVYSWKPTASKVRYVIVVSRSYVLSFHAQDPTKIAWVVRAGYKTGCGEDLSSDN